MKLVSTRRYQIAITTSLLRKHLSSAFVSTVDSHKFAPAHTQAKTYTSRTVPGFHRLTTDPRTFSTTTTTTTTTANTRTPTHLFHNMSSANMQRGMGGRIEEAFATAKDKGEAVFVSFVTAGYPKAEGKS
jgi:hypothetical protein